MHRRLGEILIQAGVIEERQLKSALAEAARWGKRVGEVLISRNDCSEQDIIRALSTQLGVPVAPLSTTVMIPQRVLQLIPAEFARERQVLPLFLSSHTGVLDVAVSDPASFELLDELRFRTGHTIRPLVAGPRELDEAIRHFYFGEKRRSGPNHPPRAAHSTPPPRTPAPMTPPPVDASKVHGASEPPSSIFHDVPGGHAASADFAAGSPTQLPDSEWTEMRQGLAAVQQQLHDVFAILREAAIAHQTLVAQLSERGFIDRKSYVTAVKSRLKDNRR